MSQPRAAHKTIRKLLKALETQGCEIICGKHYKVRVPGKERVVIIPATPGSYNRSWENTRAKLRRAGLDV